VKSEQGSEAGTARKGLAGWLKDAQGGLSAGRSFVLLLLLALAGAFIASAAGTGVWPTAVLMAILTAVPVHALIITPLARDYEAHLAAKPHGTTSSTVDTLTGIPNQRGITASLLDAMSYANRYNHPLSVALVDLDMLTNINREMGRKAGDKALQAVAASFTDTLRMPDHAGRYGDEEFLVILPSTTLKNATSIAERIRDGVENIDCEFKGKKIPVTVSIGVAIVYPTSKRSPQGALQLADQALYDSKREGRDRIKILEHEYHSLSTGVFRRIASAN